MAGRSCSPTRRMVARLAGIPRRGRLDSPSPSCCGHFFIRTLHAGTALDVGRLDELELVAILGIVASRVVDDKANGQRPKECPH